MGNFSTRSRLYSSAIHGSIKTEVRLLWSYKLPSWEKEMHFTHYIAIGLGGALGAITRVALARILPAAIMGIPAYILCINLIGCLAIGILTELMALHWSTSDTMRYFLISGVLGGFTTFSAFALEFGLLYEKQLYLSAILYATLSFFLGIGIFFAGLKIVRVLS